MPEQPAPFARRGELGWFGAFGQTWKLASLEPQRFFRSVRTDRPWSAVIFGVVALTISQWFDSLYSYLARASLKPFIDQMLRSMPQSETPLSPEWMDTFFGVPMLLGRVLAAPLIAFVALYLLAAVFHLILLVLRGAGRGFDTTLTVVGYAAGVLLLGAVPMCGGLVSYVWFVVLAIVGIAEAQRCGTGKATAAVLLPGLLVCLCCCGAIALVGALRGLGSSPSGVEL